MGRPAAGGGTWVTVQPERLDRWLSGFAGRHGEVAWEVTAERVTVTAADGSRAECTVPFPPLGGDATADLGGLVAHACIERTVGVLLVRLGGHAAGVFTGARLVSSKVGTRPVHGRSAAGGTSQKRFARRREGQAEVALGAAADVAARILLPAMADLDAVVLGGDRRAVDAVLADPRLGALRPLVSGALLDVPDPRQRVLESTPRLFRAVRVRVVGAAGSAPPS